MSQSVITFPKSAKPKHDELDADQLIVRAFYLAHDIATRGPTLLPGRPELNALVAAVLRDWARAAAEVRKGQGEGTPP